MKWPLAACTFHAHPPTVFCVFQTYSVNIDKARNWSRKKVTKLSFVSNRKFWNKNSPADCPATSESSRNAVERFQFYNTWITTGCSRWAAHAAHYKPLGRRGLFRTKTWRRFSETALGLRSPFSPEESSAFLPGFAKGWCWSHILEGGHLATSKKSYYFCLLLLFNMSSPLVCKLMKNQHLCFQQAAVSIF